MTPAAISSLLLAAVLAAGGKPTTAKPPGKAPRGTLAPGQAGESSREIFERGKTAFARGEYARAIAVLRPLLYPEPLLESESDLVQAHRMLGVAHLFGNQPEDARRELTTLLDLRPDYRFDPLIDPPQVVDFFNALLRERQAQIAELEAKRRAAEADARRRAEREAAAAREPPTVIERRYERHSVAVALIPFGAGQFQNGQNRKGWMFLGVEAGLAVISAGAFVANLASYGLQPKRECKTSPAADPTSSGGCPGGQLDTSAEETSATLYRVQLISGGLFWATVAWGVTDALMHFQREVALDGTPPAAGKGPSAFQIAPVRLGGGVASAWGPGLSFRF